MKHEINGNLNGKSLIDMCDEIECQIANSTRFLVSGEGIRARANNLMHLAADLHDNADRLAEDFLSHNNEIAHSEQTD